VFGSLTRASDLERTPFHIRPLDRDRWATGDFVVGKFVSENPSPSDEVEITTGRLVKLMKNDLLVGALGKRRATLESVGDWEEIGSDGVMEDLTRAGLFGRETSRSSRTPARPPFVYQGHAVRDESKVRMRDFVTNHPDAPSYQCPTIMLIGTSMSSGKTTASRAIIRALSDMGLRVIGVKLTGAGHFSDILSMYDAGADEIFDFIDVGMPSTVLPPGAFRRRLKLLLSRIASRCPDIVVAEAGASPFEPYNGDIALQEVGDNIIFTVLCASDPYSVIGVSQNFGVKPDLVCGITTVTDAGIQLVKKLTGIPALSLTTDESIEELKGLLQHAVKSKVNKAALIIPDLEDDAECGHVAPYS